MKVSQNALYLMFGIVLVINEFKEKLVPILAFSMTGTQFIFNVLYLFIVTK